MPLQHRLRTCPANRVPSLWNLRSALSSVCTDGVTRSIPAQASHASSSDSAVRGFNDGLRLILNECPCSRFHASVRNEINRLAEQCFQSIAKLDESRRYARDILREVDDEVEITYFRIEIAGRR